MGLKNVSGKCILCISVLISDIVASTTGLMVGFVSHLRPLGDVTCNMSREVRESKIDTICTRPCELTPCEKRHYEEISVACN